MRPQPKVRGVLVGDAAYRVFSSTAPRATPRRSFVLVHGIGTSHRYFSRLHEELSRDADTYSVDLPGFGGLPKPGAALDIEQMASGLGRVLGDAGVRDVVLVGHSMGAQWVVELAARRPDLVSGVVIIGAVTDARTRSLVVQGVRLGIDTLVEPPHVNATVFMEYLRCGPSWFLRQSRHMLGYRIEDRIADLTMPVLVVRGGADPISGVRWNRLLRDRAGQGRLVHIPGHHHVVQHSAPRAVASAIRDFVGILDGGRS